MPRNIGTLTMLWRSVSAAAMLAAVLSVLAANVATLSAVSPAMVCSKTILSYRLPSARLVLSSLRVSAMWLPYISGVHDKTPKKRAYVEPVFVLPARRLTLNVFAADSSVQTAMPAHMYVVLNPNACGALLPFNAGAAADVPRVCRADGYQLVAQIPRRQQLRRFPRHHRRWYVSRCLLAQLSRHTFGLALFYPTKHALCGRFSGLLKQGYHSARLPPCPSSYFSLIDLDFCLVSPNLFDIRT